MMCPACGGELPSAFPGATVRCACGQAVALGPASRPSHPQSVPESSPYRAAGLAPVEGHPFTCPFCSNVCPALVRICPHCDVRFDNVRCARCFSLQAPGMFACGRCGQALELEALLDATDAPCPRCSHPLEVAKENDVRLHECPRCGGLFVPKETLADLLCRAELGGALPEIASQSAQSRVDLGDVRYLPCPLCHASMNRVNFGKVSGVIVDVCRVHGTWFDAGELTRVVAFAACGGLDRTREREKRERDVERAHRAETHASFVVMETQENARTRLGLWHDFLRTVLFW